MAPLTIELPPQPVQTEFNLRRWAELLSDPGLARIEGRVETDLYGHLIMSPPPAPRHGSLQFRIGALLDRLMANGRVLTECPISTADGVRAADVAWASSESLRQLGNQVCFPRAPEICVEVLSPANSDAEIREKTALYFDAGALEVWHCAPSGAMKFLAGGGNQGSRRLWGRVAEALGSALKN
jgi:Uma2 family endonuclease